MTNVKPATDYMVGSIQKAHRHCSTTDCGDVLVLLARIESDRAEIARLKAEVERLTLQKLGMSDPPCYQCDGDGKILVRADGIAAGEAECPFCGGTGGAR